jgi:hypothetical protein
MATYYNNLLTITGPDVQAVLAAVKADTPHVDKDGQTHEVYFDPQRISGSHKQGVPHIFPDDQKICDEEGGAAIRFDTAGCPAFYPTLWLSGVFPTHTLQLKSRRQSEGSDPSIVLFRGGEASHVHEIPNHNGNTGKTATLFDIVFSHINRVQDSDKLVDGIDRAIEIIDRVKAERIAEARTTSEQGNHAEDSGDPEVVYNQALDEELEALVRPFLYTLDMIPGDEERIARLVADLRSVENPALRIEFLKEKKGKKMKPSDETLRKDGLTAIEPQQSATELPDTMADSLENLDTDFNDPRLEVEIEKGIKRSREVLEERFEALDRHLAQAAKLAVVIRALVEDERS